MAADTYHFATVDGPAYRLGGPVLFAFHGTGGNEGQFLDLAAQLLPQARIIAPRGDVSEAGALRFFKRAAEGVYDMEDLAKRTTSMADFIIAHYALNTPSAVYGLGYSNGANIMAAVIDKNPTLFSHAVMMHPLVTWDMPKATDLSTLKLLITAGRRDPICPAAATDKLAAMLVARGADLVPWWHDGGHEITPQEVQSVAQWIAAQPIIT